MIDSKLHFKPIQCLGVGTHHDACVIYQDIHLFLLCKEYLVQHESGSGF